mmetsp:Transcript_77209/g.160703  ORF Transcript_77209/g.160703 Transcript_77209/m.160703 type:complete len:278 (-) Transcript_77209:88-921(-)
MMQKFACVPEIIESGFVALVDFGIPTHAEEKRPVVRRRPEVVAPALHVGVGVVLDLLVGDRIIQSVHRELLHQKDVVLKQQSPAVDVRDHVQRGQFRLVASWPLHPEHAGTHEPYLRMFPIDVPRRTELCQFIIMHQNMDQSNMFQHSELLDTSKIVHDLALVFDKSPGDGVVVLAVACGGAVVVVVIVVVAAAFAAAGRLLSGTGFDKGLALGLVRPPSVYQVEGAVEGVVLTLRGPCCSHQAQVRARVQDRYRQGRQTHRGEPYRGGGAVMCGPP